MNWWYKIEDILGLESTRPKEAEPEEIIEPETEIPVEADDCEEEIIAVITAAIAAVLGKKPVLDFRVVSFKKRGDWDKQAYL